MEPPAYAFGRFRIDVDSRQLLRDGTHLPLAATAFDTLLLLVRHRDRAITKDELKKAVWPDRFASDDSLTQIIASLRRTLGDADVIATIPRRGYRFIVPVVENPPPDWEALREMAGSGSGNRDAGSAVRFGATPVPPVGTPGSRIPHPGSWVPNQRPRRVWIFIAALLAALTIGLLIVRALGDRETDLALPVRFTQETPPSAAIRGQ